jgi:hypothetical protein
MKRRVSALPLALTAASIVVLCGPARAADPTTADCLAASDASLKSGNEHKLRLERSQLLVCAAPSCPADIRKECIRRVDEINSAIPTIIFEAKYGSGKDLSAVKVTMDGEVLAERLQGTALSIDPGEHTFTFETAGQPPLQRQFVIREAEKDRRESVTWIADCPPGEEHSAGDPTGCFAVNRGQLTQGTVKAGLGTQKILAIVAGGVGVVGVGLGSGFGIVAMSKKSDAQSACPNQCATADGVSKWSDAKSAGTVSTVAFIVGGVALAGGAALWFTAKPESGGAYTGAAIGVGPGSLQLKATW